jgi:hypothetical protein
MEYGVGAHILIELHPDVRRTLQEEADSRGVPLDALLSELVTDAARQLRRKRIREQSEAVARYVASNREAREFCEFWGTPRAEGLGPGPKLRLSDEA